MMKIPEPYKKDIDIAISILKEEGCSEVYIFGSIAKGKTHINSDIDIAVKGINGEKFFKIFAKLMNAMEHRVDLLDLNSDKHFAKHIFKTGNIFRVA
jgi:predicted nucleotidyltransferase